MFDNAATQSTFVWTLLLSIGLFFFIRASAKDRIETEQFLATQPEAELRDLLRQYFAARSYKVINRDKENDKVTFEGFVAPSKFLAGLLSALAGVGGLCLGLVISLSVPESGYWPLGLVAIAPLAGVFYWKTSGRVEQVVLRVEILSEAIETEAGKASGRITVKGHRDEVESLRLALDLIDS
ncbi:MAG: cofactor assembly of complex C subunit B [Cyanophyceae cyanobacterium]